MNLVRTTPPWILSGCLHLTIFMLAVVVLTWPKTKHSIAFDIAIIVSARPAQPVTLSKPVPKEEPKARQVYGISRKALTDEHGPDVKQGNTIAKAPDDQMLLPSDADSIPIPTEDYLVTQMPQLEKDVVVPYPPEVKARGVQGVVVMDLLIDASGKVRKVDLVEGPDPALNTAAVQAAAGFRFKPAYLQDKPVAVKIRYAYRFVIKG